MFHIRVLSEFCYYYYLYKPFIVSFLGLINTLLFIYIYSNMSVYDFDFMYCGKTNLVAYIISLMLIFGGKTGGLQPA